MKVFFGLSLNQSLLNAVEKWRNEHKNLPVRWLRDEDLHITLIAPWEEENVQYAKKLMPQIESLPDLAINFDRIELGPSPERRSLIWALGEVPPGLLQFKYNAETVFEKPHNPRFLLHLTLARLNGPKPIPFVSQNVDWKGDAEAAILYQSLGGSRYVKLAEKPKNKV